MKKLTREEAEKIKTRPYGSLCFARETLMFMDVGDFVLIEPKEWSQPSRPLSTYVRLLSRKTGMRWNCRKAADGSGWVVERVK